jgi:hypothetical protein
VTHLNVRDRDLNASRLEIIRPANLVTSPHVLDFRAVQKDTSFYAQRSKCCCRFDGHSQISCVSWSRSGIKTVVSEVSMMREMDEVRSDLSSSVGQRRLGSNQQSLALPELSVSGSRVLLALAVAVFSMGALMWMFVRYWLFAP